MNDDNLTGEVSWGRPQPWSLPCAGRDDGNRLGGCGCECKHRRSRSLLPGQPALKRDWLTNDVAASKVADRHDQPRATVAVAKIALDGIRPSAAVPSLGVCPEPSSISWAICPSVRCIRSAASFSGKKVASEVRRSQPQASAMSGNLRARMYYHVAQDTRDLKAWILANVLMISSK